MMSCSFSLGIIDPDVHRWPVWDKILATCRQKIEREEYESIIRNFNHYLSIMEEQGHIPDQYFDDCGVRMDKDVHGKVVVRSATIAQESYQRSKCLSHEYQKKLRRERHQSIQAKVTEKMMAENAKHQLRIVANSEVVALLCQKLQKEKVIGEDEFGEEHLEKCTIEIFAGLSNAQLEAFIFARDTNYRTKASLPAKGTLEEAKTNTDPTKRKRIQVAFDCRLLPNFIEGKQPHDLSPVVNDEQVRSMNVQRIILNEDKTILPSTLLSHESWVKYAVDLLALDKTSSTPTEVTSFDKEKADNLLRKLEVRYKLHVNTRISDASKRNHWVLALAYKNLPVVAACMILSSHLAMDIKCLGRLSCLLAPNANTFIPCADNSSMNRQGAYLYFDNNRGTFIRSGKVVRRGFVDRHKEHMAESKKDKPESEFYLLYPSKHGRRSDKQELLGHFENLTQVVAAGFDASSEPAMFLSKNNEQGGLLIMNNDDLRRIDSVLKTKHLSQLQKCQEFIAYLFEFGYDLAINPDMNVSRSPGFESFLCIYGGSGV